MRRGKFRNGTEKLPRYSQTAYYRQFQLKRWSEEQFHVSMQLMTLITINLPEGILILKLNMF